MSDNPVQEIIELFYSLSTRIKFIKYLNEYNVIHGNKIFEDGLDQAYWMTCKKELTLDRKNFKNYELI